MEVKISGGAFTPKPAGKGAKPQKPGGVAAPFTDLLRAAKTAAESALGPDGEDFSAQTPEEVFARALANRENPDLDKLDEYMEWLIGREQ